MTDEIEDGEIPPGGSEAAFADPESSPNVLAMDRWETVIEDMDATAEELEEAGWETLTLHPGDVAPEPGADKPTPGIDFVLPDGEYEQLEQLVQAGFRVDEVEIFRADESSLTYFISVLQDGEHHQAVLLPGYYRPIDETVQSMFDRAHEEGHLQFYLRRLTGAYVSVTVEDPALVSPSGDSGERDAEQP
ncbi:MAG: hypothetical protein ABEJ60_03025 [Halodesulfurarchaeum sp.]